VFNAGIKVVDPRLITGTVIRKTVVELRHFLDVNRRTRTHDCLATKMIVNRYVSHQYELSVSQIRTVQKKPANSDEVLSQ
jgi:hypothetical protein